MDDYEREVRQFMAIENARDRRAVFALVVVALFVLAYFACGCAWVIRNSECAPCAGELCLETAARHWACVEKHQRPPTIIPPSCYPLVTVP